MLRIAYFDCFGGISGDMCLGALIDAGLDPKELEAELKKGGIADFHLKTQAVQRQGIGATQVSVVLTEKAAPFRGLTEIRAILNQSCLSPAIKQKAASIFQRLAEAEAQIHKIPVEKIHFHEVGATDALVDILGTLIGLEKLGVKQIYASALPVGTGPVICAHGILPNPAPATLTLCQGIPVYPVAVEGELVTPTGAALITGLADEFATWPPMQIEQIGYGAGSHDFPRANVLRIWIGKKPEKDGLSLPDLVEKITPPPPLSAEKTVINSQAVQPNLRLEEVYLLESSIDDMNPEWFTHLRAQLEKAGALEVYYRQLLMKKGRPGTELCVLTHARTLPAVARIILGETTTLGVRIRSEKRLCLPRQIKLIATPVGPIKVKVAWAPTGNGKWYKRTKPEFDSLLEITQKTSLTGPEIETLIATACAQK